TFAKIDFCIIESSHSGHKKRTQPRGRAHLFLSIGYRTAHPKWDTPPNFISPRESYVCRKSPTPAHLTPQPQSGARLLTRGKSGKGTASAVPHRTQEGRGFSR